MQDQARVDRIARVVAGVIGQAVEDARAAGIVILDGASPEAKLGRCWAAAALGSDRVWAVEPRTLCDAGIDPGLLDSLDALTPPERERSVGRALAARHGALLAHPANKTVLLLGHESPPEPLLPLGDLFASQVVVLAGEWSGPDDVRELAQRAGGIDALDQALEELIDRRSVPDWTAAVRSDGAHSAFLEALERRRFGRRRIGLVPKLGARTLGIDLFA